MRCLSCNCELTDEESVRMYKTIPEYVDLCSSCFKTTLGYYEEELMDDLEEDNELQDR